MTLRGSFLPCQAAIPSSLDKACISLRRGGRVWLKAPVSKTDEGKPSVSSNLTLSAISSMLFPLHECSADYICEIVGAFLVMQTPFGQMLASSTLVETMGNSQGERVRSLHQRKLKLTVTSLLSDFAGI